MSPLLLRESARYKFRGNKCSELEPRPVVSKEHGYLKVQQEILDLNNFTSKFCSLGSKIYSVAIVNIEYKIPLQGHALQNGISFLNYGRQVSI